MAAVWHYARAWVWPLNGRQLLHTGPAPPLPYQAAIADAWSLILSAHAAAAAHPHTHLLPTDSLPTIHTFFDDGPLTPATQPLGAPAPLAAPQLSAHLLCPDRLDDTCLPHAQRAASAVVSSAAFLALYSSPATTAAGRARLLDGSVALGPSTTWRRVPVAPPPSPEQPLPLSTPAPLFAFPADKPHLAPIALALDLLLDPPVDGDGPCTVCIHPSCAASPVVAHGERHYLRCPHGMRLGASVHHPVVRQLIALLDHVFSPSAVIGERGPGTHGTASVASWLQDHPGVAHSPDIVVRTATGRYILIDVKTLDVTSVSHIAAHHTDRLRLPAHVHAAEHCRRAEYGTLPSLPGITMELVVVVVSTTGAIGQGGQRFIDELARRTGGHVPPTLLDQATWAAPTFGAFARMALSFAARRGLAAAVAASLRRVPSPPLPLPVPPPILPLTLLPGDGAACPADRRKLGD